MIAGKLAACTLYNEISRFSGNRQYLVGFDAADEYKMRVVLGTARNDHFFLSFSSSNFLFSFNDLALIFLMT